MPAHEKLSEVQFGYRHYPPSESGTSFSQHRVSAQVGGNEIGHMSWSKHGLHFIDVNPEHRRQGVATALWNEGHRIASADPSVVKPAHTPDRTDSGDAWARSVGGKLPRRRP